MFAEPNVQHFARALSKMITLGHQNICLFVESIYMYNNGKKDGIDIFPVWNHEQEIETGFFGIASLLESSKTILDGI